MPNGKKKEEDPIKEALRNAAPADVAVAYLPVQRERTILQPFTPERRASIRSLSEAEAAKLGLGQRNLAEVVYGLKPGQAPPHPIVEALASIDPIEFVDAPVAAGVAAFRRGRKVKSLVKEYADDVSNQIASARHVRNAGYSPTPQQVENPIRLAILQQARREAEPLIRRQYRRENRGEYLRRLFLRKDRPADYSGWRDPVVPWDYMDRKQEEIARALTEAMDAGDPRVLGRYLEGSQHIEDFPAYYDRWAKDLDLDAWRSAERQKIIKQALGAQTPHGTPNRADLRWATETADELLVPLERLSIIRGKSYRKVGGAAFANMVPDLMTEDEVYKIKRALTARVQGQGRNGPVNPEMPWDQFIKKVGSSQLDKLARAAAMVRLGG